MIIIIGCDGVKVIQTAERQLESVHERKDHMVDNSIIVKRNWNDNWLMKW